MRHAIPGLLLLSTIIMRSQENDPYQWLESVDGKRSLEWVEKQNRSTSEVLNKQTSYKKIYDQALLIYNSTDRIAHPSIIGKFYYNFWQDEKHERGIWRRTTRESYLSGDPQWETVIDIDDLCKKENVKWVFHGAEGLYPNYERFLISLSRGGGDANTIREFDAVKKEFIKDGFVMPEAKGDLSYYDENTVVVSTDFGKGSMTTSGYARQVKLWKRGTPLKDAKLIFEGKVNDVSASAYDMRDGDKRHLFFERSMTFYASEHWIYENEKPLRLDIREEDDVDGLLKDHLVITLKSDWTVNGKTYRQGSLVSLELSPLMRGEKVAHLIYEPDELSSISETAFTKNKLLLCILTDVKSEMFIYTPGKEWTREKVKAPDLGTIGFSAVDENSDDYFFSYENFLTPSSLYSADASNNTFTLYKSLPAFFDGSKFSVAQYKARSNDGTLVPYFVVGKKDMVLDGKNPTLLYAYGGFESPELPFYSATIGKGWLEEGGVYVLANIRGGSEYGPKWHQAGLKEKRQNVYNDFHSIAQDIIDKKITSPRHLGIMGGSNGGLLMGVAFTQRPDLYGAVVCQVPLLDMKRYNKLLAGASWMGEYGNPDIPEEWEFIKKYSPYQNLKKDTKYPEVFFMTSTRDDRVHPGHARKMAAKMIDMGYKIYYYENTEGGHGGSSTNDQRAKWAALEFSYLLMKLKN